MKAFKGFKKDLTCRGFQYEQGKTFETDEAVVDGETIKPDTWYKLEGGEFVEVKDHDQRD